MAVGWGRMSDHSVAGLGDTRTNSNRATHTGLALLHPQIRQQDRQDILRAQTLGNVTERVDRRTTNTLLVRLQEI